MNQLMLNSTFGEEDEKEYKKILYKQFYNTWFNITELNLKKYDVNIEM